jgi:GT2 family glycosyltransferase/glycosyltransferase involved in cell wall biosynthesis
MNPRSLARAVVPRRTRRFLRVALWKLRSRLQQRKSASWQLDLELFTEDDPQSELELPAVAGAPLVSIVIPARDQWVHTHRCLRSLATHAGSVSFEVVLADDESSDTTTRAGRLVRNLRVVRTGGVGFLEATNAAAVEARGRYVVLLNNDTIVQEGWLDALVEIAEGDPEIGIVGAKLVSPDGSLLEAGCTVFRDGRASNDGRTRNPRAPRYEVVTEVDYVSAACLLIRRSLWEATGGFDSRFAPAYYEDTDLAFEVRNRGYSVVVQPRSVVVHVEGASHGTDVTRGLKSFQERNRAIFHEKWRTVLEHEHLEFGARGADRRTREAVMTVLAVDRSVPRPDWDAGGRFVFSYLELLARRGYEVVFVSDGSGDNQPYVDALRQRRVEYVPGPWPSGAIDDWLSHNGVRFQIAYISRPAVATRWIPALRRYSSARIIYSPVDLHFLRERRRYELTGAEDARTEAERLKNEEIQLLREADVVHVVSTHEQEIVERVARDTTVRTVPIFFWREAPGGGDLGFHDRADLMFVGGFQHAPNRDAACWFAEEVLPLVRARVAAVRLYVVGSSPTPDVAALAGEHVIVTGRISDERLATMYGQVRVVVCPLRFGAGLKGKVVEALRHGVPSVVTPIAAEGLPGTVDGLRVADAAEELADAVVDLYTHQDAWEDLSRRASLYCDAMFSEARAIEVVDADFAPVAAAQRV